MYRESPASPSPEATEHQHAPRALSREERLALLRAGLARYLARREAELAQVAHPEADDLESDWDPEGIEEVLCG